MDTEKNQMLISMETNLHRWLKGAVCLAVAALVSYFLWFSHLGAPISEKPSDWGSFGDFFNGLVSPFLNFIMILAVIRTVALTRIMISEQRKQMTQSNNLMRVSTAIQGVSSLMDYHENLYKTFDDSNDRLLKNINDAQDEIAGFGTVTSKGDASARVSILNYAINEHRKKFQRNLTLMIAYKKIVAACSKAILQLSLSTPDSAEADILLTAKLIDDAVVTHLLPLEKND